MMIELDDKLVCRMVVAAKDVSYNAYCPYSEFSVGASVLGESGALYAGCNVENASYGLTICAERSAVLRAVAEGEKRILAVVVYTRGPEPAAPCGACRQVIAELGPDAELFCVCDGPEVLRTRIGQLLPRPFGAKSIEHATKGV